MSEHKGEYIRVIGYDEGGTIDIYINKTDLSVSTAELHQMLNQGLTIEILNNRGLW
jgi:hypothetical protein